MSYTHPRELERFNLELPALVEVLESNQKNIRCYPMMRDISGNGGYFLTKNPLAVNTRIKVGLIFEINKPDASERKGHFFLEFTGKVIRVDASGMAVRFDQDYQHVPVNLPG